MSESGIAIRNALILGASLLGTWSVALVVRLVIPRYLGPELLGGYTFVENLAATCFIFVGLGVDVYIQKEVPNRPQHADDFMGGVLAARAILGILVFAVMCGIGWSAQKNVEQLAALMVFGVAALFAVNSSSLSTLLLASRTVGKLAVLNVACKLIWGAVMFLTLALRQGLFMLALAFLASEILRFGVLWHLARRKLGVKIRMDRKQTWAVLMASAPFYVNAICITIYAKIDINIMAFLANDTEIGWYGAAANFAGLSMLMAPLINWVLTPQLSRASARSNDELMEMMRRSLQGILQLAVPICLGMGLGAEIWIGLVFGKEFVPAMSALKALAPMFVLTYASMVVATCLLMTNRGWTVTVISVSSLLANALLNYLLIPWLAPRLGPGGVGTVAGFISTGVEATVTLSMLIAIGRQALDAPFVSATLRAIAAAAVVVAGDRYLPLGPIPRLAVDLGLYAVLALLVGAIKIKDITAVIQAVRNVRQGAPQEPAAGAAGALSG